MSLKTLAAAGSAAVLLPLTPAFAENSECNPETISGNITLTYLQETRQSGEVSFNPGQEIVARLHCGDRLTANFSADIRTNAAFDYDGVRLETASLTYRAGDLENPWIITAGRLGQQRLLEALAGGPGTRPDVGARDSIIASRVDNLDLLGIGVQKTFTLSEEWRVSVDGRSFAATQIDQGLSRVEDRANSHDPSFTWKATLSRNAYRLGIEGGHIENGPTGTAAENYLGIFARFSRPLSDTVTWSSSAEIVHFENYFNIAGQDRTRGFAFSDLQWRPDDTRLTLWGQLGLNTNSVDTDMGFVEIGGRYDVLEIDDTALSLFLAADLQQELEGRAQTYWGGQVGFRLTQGF